MSLQDTNGDRPNGVRKLTLSLNVHTQRLHIDGDEMPFDEMLGMLERARLEIDARYRFNRGRELLAEQAKEMMLQQTVRDAMAGRKIQG